MVQGFALEFVMSSGRYTEPAPASPWPSESLTSPALHSPLSAGWPTGGAAGVEAGLDVAVVTVVVAAGDAESDGVELLAAFVVPPLPQAESARTPAEAATTGNNRESFVRTMSIASLVWCYWVDVPIMRRLVTFVNPPPSVF